LTQSTRKYDASRRQRQAQVTRNRIVEAARELFIERGYAGTTLAAVAERADVALPTVYGAVGSKRALLADLVEGRPEEAEVPTRLLAPSDVERITAAATPIEKVRRFADHASRNLDAAYELLVALRAAAGVEDDAAELERRVEEQRLDDIRTFARHLSSTKALQPGVTPQSAAETIWVLTDVQVFRMLVKSRGWSVAKYRKWLTENLQAQLLTGE
jgi:AcrR family transcriptional regulator